jgi:hypothetical protein
MKANLVSTRVVKAALALVASVVLFISNPLTSQARTFKNKKTPTTLTESQVSVSYVGSNANGLVFNVKFENPTGEKFWLILKDDAGEIIFRQQFNDLHFSRSVQLEKGDSEIQHPTFIIRKGNDESVHSFDVSLITTQQVTVTKL